MKYLIRFILQIKLILLLLSVPWLITHCSVDSGLDQNALAQGTNNNLVIKLRLHMRIGADAKSLQLISANSSATNISSLKQLNQILSKEEIVLITPLILNQTLSKELDKYFSIKLRAGISSAKKQALIKSLKKIILVEHAYLAPTGKDAGMATPGS